MAMERFANTTDLHGVRHAMNPQNSKIRRFVWLILVALAVAGFIFFSGLRLKYYFSYPYFVRTQIEENFLPLPAMAICPAKSSAPPQEWFTNFTLEELVYFGYEHYGLSVSQLDDTLIPFDETDLDRIDHNLPNCSGYEDTKTYFVQAFKNITHNNSSRSVQFSKESYKKYVRKVHTVNLDDILSCQFIQANLKYDCKADFQQVLTQYGYCLFIDNTRATTYQFLVRNTEVWNYLEFVLRFHHPVHNVLMMLLQDADDAIYTRNYDMQWDYASLCDKSLKLKYEISSMHTIHSLGQLYYGEESCSDISRHRCIYQCMLSNLNCSVHFSDFGKDITKYQKPLCPLSFQTNKGASTRIFENTEQFSYCDAECQLPCKRLKYITNKSNSIVNPKSDRQKLTVEITYDYYNFKYMVYTEEELYPLGSLLGELGGTMGLMIGSSLLTLCHLVEFLVIKVLQPIFSTRV